MGAPAVEERERQVEGGVKRDRFDVNLAWTAVGGCAVMLIVLILNSVLGWVM